MLLVTCSSVLTTSSANIGSIPNKCEQATSQLLWYSRNGPAVRVSFSYAPLRHCRFKRLTDAAWQLHSGFGQDTYQTCENMLSAAFGGKAIHTWSGAELRLGPTTSSLLPASKPEKPTEEKISPGCLGAQLADRLSEQGIEVIPIDPVAGLKPRTGSKVSQKSRKAEAEALRSAAAATAAPVTKSEPAPSKKEAKASTKKAPTTEPVRQPKPKPMTKKQRQAEQRRRAKV